MATGDPPPGADPPAPDRSPRPPHPGSCAPWVPGGPALMQHPGCAPLRRGGKMKVQTMAPLWAGRRQGGVSLQDVRHWQRRQGRARWLPQIPPRA